MQEAKNMPLSRRRLAIGLSAAGLLTVGGTGAVLASRRENVPGAPKPVEPSAHRSDPSPAAESDLVYERSEAPSRTIIKDRSGRTVAVCTDGARTVLVYGPTRTFKEPQFTSVTITTSAWIRLAPQVFSEGSHRADWFAPWLEHALTDTSPDVFEVATQYLAGSPDRHNDEGVRIAGDAQFGPESDTDPDGRAENSDFQDYLGISWNFADRGMVPPKTDRYGNMDCSGYTRTVLGYRLGFPLLGGNTRGEGLARRAYAISAFGPGVEIVPDRGSMVRDYHLLQPGDLVFFDTDPNTPGQNDHMGIYLDVDSQGHLRFISSRSKANGPTFGDLGGPAILDGGGYFSARFRNARRI